MNPPGDPLFSVGQRVHLASAPGIVRVVSWRVWSVNRRCWVYRVDGFQINHPESELVDAPQDDSRRLVTVDDLDVPELKRRGFDFSSGQCYTVSKCPGCARIRLEDGGWMFVWLEPEGCALSADPHKPDACSCGRSLSEPLPPGADATLARGVTREELAKSAWSWVARPS